jgi:hypothetical protein
MPGDDIDSSISTAPSNRTAGTLAMTPARSGSVMRCTSSSFRLSSQAICWFDTFKPMTYRHNSQIRSGWWWPARTVPVRSSKRT